MQAILLIIYIAAGFWALSQIISDDTLGMLTGGWDPWGIFLFKCFISLGFAWAFIIIALIKMLIMRLLNKHQK